MGLIRFFMRTVAGVVILCVIAALLVFFFGSGIAATYVASQLTNKLHVRVDITSIRPYLTSIQVSNLRIGNPAGYKLPRAFSADSISINAPLTRYANDHVEIDSIEINDIYLGLEFDSIKGTEGNWTAIMASTNEAQETSKKESVEKSKKSVLIKTLGLNNIKTDLLFRDKGSVKHLPDIQRIELHNVSSEGGNLTDQLMNSALGEMVKQVFVQQNMKDLLQKILDPNNRPNLPGIFRGIFSLETDDSEQPAHLTSAEEGDGQ